MAHNAILPSTLPQDVSRLGRAIVRAALSPRDRPLAEASPVTAPSKLLATRHRTPAGTLRGTLSQKARPFPATFFLVASTIRIGVSRLALWLFGLVVLIKSAISLNSIFNGYVVASSADGIPLDTYPTAAAGTVVSLVALLGLSHFTLCLLSVLVLIRYRSMIPLMLALLLLEHLSRRLILYLMPIVRSGTPPGSAISLVLLAFMIVGLGLSLRSRGQRGTSGAGGAS